MRSFFYFLLGQRIEHHKVYKYRHRWKIAKEEAFSLARFLMCLYSST